MKTFVCRKCNLDKPETEFYVWKKNGRRRQECNNCKRLMMLKYRHENLEHTNMTARISHQRSRKERPGDAILWAAKQRSKKLGLPFNLDKNDIVVPEFCPVLGIKLIVNLGGTTGSDNSPSIDRIIPELGYVKGNIEIISKKANTIKSYGTKEDHEKIVLYMKNCEERTSGKILHSA